MANGKVGSSNQYDDTSADVTLDERLTPGGRIQAGRPGFEQSRWSLAGLAGGRKVRTPQGRVLDNVQRG
jgi:hypothetical protein